MAQIPDAGRVEILVPRQDEQQSRTASLTIRYASFDFLPPINRATSFPEQSVTLNVISALEDNPNPEAKPIQWLLLTTLEVSSFEEAVRYIRWYTYRWLIERYHYVLKSGCQIEQLQLKSAERIKKALATYGIVAWRYAKRYPLGLLWLIYQMVVLGLKLFGEDYSDCTILPQLGSCYIPLNIIIYRLMGKA